MTQSFGQKSMNRKGIDRIVLRELRSVSLDPIGRKRRYSLMMFAWGVLAAILIILCVVLQESDRYSDYDAVAALASGICLGIAFLYLNARNQVEVVAQCLDLEKIGSLAQECRNTEGTT